MDTNSPYQSIKEWTEWLGDSYGESIALSAHDGSIQWTFTEIQNWIRQTSARLIEFGATSSSIILIGLPDGPEAILSLLAVSSTAVALPVPANETEEFYQSLFSTVEIGAVFMTDRPSAPLTKVSNKNSVPLLFYPDTLNGLVKINTEKAIISADLEDIQSIALLSLTSGSTSEPKLVGQSHASLLATIAQHAEWNRFTEKDRSLCMMPIAHLHSIWRSSLSILHAGGSVCWTKGFQLPAALEWFEIHRPTYISMVPTFYKQLVAHAEMHSWKPPNALNLASIGSDKVESELCEKISNTLNCEVVQFYGLSEVSPCIAMNRVGSTTAPRAMDLNSDWNLRILDESMQTVASGEQGEIWVRGGYINKVISGPAPTMCDDGYLKTGDIGYVIADNRLVVTGRTDDRITRGGQKIHPSAVEDVVKTIPNVLEAYAFGVADDIFGEKTALVVSGSVAESEVRAFCESHLRSYMVPDYIYLEEAEIPKKSNGKVSRKLLSTHYQRKGVPATKESITLHDEQLTGRIHSVFRKQNGFEKLGIGEDYFEAGGNSLSAIEILIELEQEIGISVPPAILAQDASPLAVSHYVSKKLNDSAEKTKPKYSQIIKATDTDVMVCLMPGIGGSVGFGHGGDTKISTQHSVLIVQGHTNPAEPGPWNNLSEMAAEISAEVSAIVANKKLVFVGYSMGAHVAVHMATACINRGSECPAVVVIDDDPEVEKRHFGIANTKPEKGQEDYNRWLLAASAVTPLQSNIIFFRAEQNQADYLSDPTQGWSDICSGNVFTINVSGGHHMIIKREAMQEISGVFDDYIQKSISAEQAQPPSRSMLRRYEARTAARNGSADHELDLLEKLVDDDHKQPLWVYHTLFKIYAERQQEDKAEWAFHKAISLNQWPLSTCVQCIPHAVNPLRKRLWRSCGHLVEEEKGNHASIAHAIGQCYLAVDKPLIAGRWFRTGLNIAPNHENCKQGQIRAFGQSTRIKPLVRRIEKILTNKPKARYRFYLLQAKILVTFKQPNAALAILDNQQYFDTEKTEYYYKIRESALSYQSADRVD